MAHVRMYRTRSCPFCVKAERLLKKRGVKKIELVDVGTNRRLLKIMLQETKRNTVPQIFIGNYHVGGFDELSMLDKKGKLVSLLNHS